ncbi:MAG: glycosyltransferase family 2 protein [Patescibacteria group bacterium]
MTHQARRFWEILPGALSWTILSLPVVFSFVWPAGVAYFIILFDTYWLVKALVMGGHLISGYLHLRRNTAINWLERCKKTTDLAAWSDTLFHQFHLAGWGERWRLHEEWEQVERMKNLPAKQKNWQDIYHVFLYPVYRESYEVLETSVRACLTSNYPKDKIIILLTVEARGGAAVREDALRICREYGKSFLDFIVTVHPDEPDGKMKGANGYWAGKLLQKYIDDKGISYDDVIVHYFDADTLPHREYLPCVTYQYVMNPQRTFRSYQPIPLFNNNIWDVPAINRLVALGSSYWQMIESTRPYRLINFSSQAMSLKTLVDIDFYDRQVVSDDSRQFYRAYFQYNGNHKAVPIFTPVSMDAVLGKSWWGTLRAQYIQKRRWAWGIEHFPYLMEKYFSTRGQLTWMQRVIHPFRTLEGHVSWATSSLLIALGGWMPLLLNENFRTTVLAFNLPILARNILSITWIGIVISTFISFSLLPPRPKKYTRFKNMEMIFQWVLVPISGIFFGSIPALDAETRLMLGKYLGFAVTHKERKSKISTILTEKTPTTPSK